MERRKVLTSTSNEKETESENSSKDVLRCIPLPNSDCVLPPSTSPCPLFLTNAESVKARAKLVESEYKTIESTKVPEQTTHPLFADKLIGPKEQDKFGKIIEKAVNTYCGSQVDDIYFSYKEFQDTLWLSSQIMMNNRIKVLLKEKLGIVRDGPSRPVTRREFENTYGPVNVKNKQACQFLMAYHEYMEEWKDEFANRLSYLQKIQAKLGDKVALNIVNEERAQLFELQKIILKNKDKNMEIYDLNKFTNKTHSEWLLIPRPKQKQLDLNFVLRQPELSNLVEFQSTGRVGYVDGYWPSIVDTRAHQVRIISIDPVPPPEDPGERVIRKQVWGTFHRRMLTCIYKFPLGISMKHFFDFVCDKHKYNVEFKFFGSIDPNEAVDTLKEVFHVECLPKIGYRILFPAYLRDVLPPIEEIVLKVWRRTAFLVKINNGKVRAKDMKRLYLAHFGVAYPCLMWGFPGTHEFVRYCKTTWDKELGCEIELVLMEHVNDHMLLYKKN